MLSVAPATAWHSRSAERVTAELQTDPARGLDDAEAQRRLAELGYNALERRSGPGVFRRLLRQFTDVTVLALLVAAMVAVVLAIFERPHQPLLERFGDAIAIFAIVVLNALIGFVHERKAENALRALEELSAPRARIRRESREQIVPAAELVIGDIVLLRQGDRVAADLRLLQTVDTRVSEAVLTGESVPIDKRADAVLEAETSLAERSNMAFTGTHVAGGRATGVVVATGMATEIGRIAGLLDQVESPETPLQQNLQKFGTRVVVGCVAIAAVVFVIGMWRLQQGLGFLLLTAVSLAVAAIPEGLPAITTIVLALGVQRMARKQAVVRRLAAVETLGSVHVVCTDKTGTLTQNRMDVRRLWTDAGDVRVEDGIPSGARAALTELLLACRFAAEAHLPADGRPESVSGDPTDAALLRLHLRHGSPPIAWQTLRELSFDGTRKLASVVGALGNEVRGYTHGAAERVLDRSRRILEADGNERELRTEDRARIAELVDRWASDGLRVLALARSIRPRAALSSKDATAEFEHDLTLLGLLAIADPPRPGVAEAVRTARAAGVETVMITGDHELTARSIASELGILESAGEIVKGSDLETRSPEQLEFVAPQIRVVARATALTKMQLVQALAARGYVVAMTGDGVNDAPAMKAANIGIAMGKSGTDVAREAADLVLMDDNYETIVGAIAEGRTIYANIKRFILFLFTANAGLVLAVLIAALLGWPPILTPTQILWINLITNGLPALALGMEPCVDDPMKQPPRPIGEPLVTRRELAQLTGYGAWMAVLGLGIFGVWHARAGAAGTEHGLATARTLAFTVLALAPMFHSLTARSEQRSVFQLGLLTNWRLVGAFVFAAALQAVAIYVPLVEHTFGTRPLSASELGVAIVLAASVWLVGEIHKLALRIKWGRQTLGKSNPASASETTSSEARRCTTPQAGAKETGGGASFVRSRFPGPLGLGSPPHLLRRREEATQILRIRR